METKLFSKGDQNNFGKILEAWLRCSTFIHWDIDLLLFARFSWLSLLIILRPFSN